MNQVSATGDGQWPGIDPVEASRIVRGELGAPHLPFLPELPQRGVGADAVGRTAAILTELPVDVQPYGWRLVPMTSRDHRRAMSLLNTDINALADVMGAEENPGGELKIQLRGPWSLAANLHLHHGERALSDTGARRDILQSFCSGMEAHIAKVQQISRGASIVVQLDEPEVDRVLAGAIPTASGYRTLRSVPEPEVLAAWRTAADTAHSAGAVEIAVNGPASGVPLQKLAESGMDAIGVNPDGLSMPNWENVATAVEAGRRIWVRLAMTTTASGPGQQTGQEQQTGRNRQTRGGQQPDEVPQVSALAGRILEPWHRLGLPLSQLVQLRLMPASSLADAGPATARRILSRLTSTADALNQTAAE